MKMMKTIMTAATIAVLGFTAQAFAEGSAARALFAQSIVDREPVGEVVEMANDTSKIYFYTELRGLKGQSITHRWEYGGEPHAAVSFNIGSNRWRTWSSKNLQPNWTGLWKVSVVDEGGNVLAEETLNYVTAEASAESMEHDMEHDMAHEEMSTETPAE